MKNADETRKNRIAALYRRDGAMTLRTSHENPEIQKLYETFYGHPLSELAEKMLHTSYQDQSQRIQKAQTESAAVNAGKGKRRKQDHDQMEMQSLRLYL